MSDTVLDVFVRTRPRLFRIAHRIVHNVHDAEDILQEVWLRWHRTDHTAVINAEAFLATATSRLAINHIQSARHRRETHAISWRHEQAVDPAADPRAETERGEEIELAVHLLLERLPPSELAAFMLREGFEYPYRQIAEALQIGTANARQLVRRARVRISGTRSHPFSPAARDPLLRAFAPAARGGDLTRLEALLAADLKPAG
ncbi:sigma-70 family RNA polymerase sigma factor [Nonomuraea sp. NPDC049709]|uniref:sigma-70 family RNA polymerase sigma factor n=1 Tax=Nonomuraea sp. NPDC049709 TaxID=3154736 RepID=UPI003424884B